MPTRERCACSNPGSPERSQWSGGLGRLVHSLPCGLQGFAQRDGPGGRGSPGRGDQRRVPPAARPFPVRGRGPAHVGVRRGRARDDAAGVGGRAGATALQRRGGHGARGRRARPRPVGRDQRAGDGAPARARRRAQRLGPRPRSEAGSRAPSEAAGRCRSASARSCISWRWAARARRSRTSSRSATTRCAPTCATP